MKELFQNIMGGKPNKNAFDLSHERKFSLRMGDLVPILCEEVIPGDTWKMNTEVLMRMAPMLAPIMHRVNVFTHFFFVPNRIIWNDWEKFVTGGEDGTEEPVAPFFKNNDAYFQYYHKAGQLADYLGVATRETNPTGSNFKINALPFRAYTEIYNEYYRDQNLEDKIEQIKTSGEQTSQHALVMRKRAWEKDYFTSALPWTQRGGDVTLPIGGTAPVFYNDTYSAEPKFVNDDTGDPTGIDSAVSIGVDGVMVAGGADIAYDPNGTLSADLSAATSANIEELRRATKLQTWLERNARGGSRYIEQIMSHFGVRSSDARLQRPEFLGGGRTPVVISEVLQTSSTDTETPQGNMAGHAISAGNSHSFKKYFEEHGYIMGIMSVLPKTSYQQGTRRIFYKTDKFDYYWPEFAQLGEQPVLNGELYSAFNDVTDTETFGYQARYSEYKYIPSSVHGDFKNSLSFWHMGRIFTSAPALNNDFVKATTDAINTRVFAAGDIAPQLWCQVYHNIKAIRPIPKFNNPSLI